MIFRRGQLQLICDGIKIQTRRPVQPDQDRNHYRPGLVRSASRGVGVPAITRIRIVTVRREQLHDIDRPGLAAEGHRDLASFARLWLELHDTDGRIRRSAGRDPHAVNGIGDDMVLNLWHERHARRQVWVLAFERIAEEPPLLLAARGGGAGPTHPFRSSRQLGDSTRRAAAARDDRRRREGIGPRPVMPESAEHLAARGYTASAAMGLDGEPESVGDVTGLMATLEARQRWELDRLEVAALLRDLPLTARVDNARRLARSQHDGRTVSDLRVVERLAWSEREEQAARRLDAIEGRLLSVEARQLFPLRAVAEDEALRAA